MEFQLIIEVEAVIFHQNIHRIYFQTLKIDSQKCNIQRLFEGKLYFIQDFFFGYLCIISIFESFQQLPVSLDAFLEREKKVKIPIFYAHHWLLCCTNINDQSCKFFGKVFSSSMLFIWIRYCEFNPLFFMMSYIEKCLSILLKSDICHHFSMMIQEKSVGKFCHFEPTNFSNLINLWSFSRISFQ